GAHTAYPAARPARVVSRSRPGLPLARAMPVSHRIEAPGSTAGTSPSHALTRRHHVAKQASETAAHTPSPTAAASDDQDAQTGAERRRHHRLRELVDEMLISVRHAVNRELWTPEERRQAEADLERVMNDVRLEAVWRGKTPGVPES